MGRLMGSVALAAVLGLTACGGGGSDDKAAQTTPSSAAPATTAAVGNDQAGTPFCQLARTYTEKYNTLLANASDPVKLRAVTTDAESAIRQAQASAPAEVKADVTVVASTASQVLAALQKNNFDLAKTPEVSKLQDPGFQTSFANLNRYARAHCGVN
jgi:ABC-type glycerol-3-phosphate transport system substrate-binding protein